jgi:hypothetical protein
VGNIEMAIWGAEGMINNTSPKETLKILPFSLIGALIFSSYIK